MIIDIKVEIPNGDTCYKCKFKEPTYSLYSEPECILFSEKIINGVDGYLKCSKCKEFNENDNDEWV